MNTSKVTLTRKIQLLIDLPSMEERIEAFKTLYRWQNRCYRAANLIASHLFVQGMIKEFLYLSEEVKYKLVDQKKDELGILNRSRMNSTYRLISDRFKGEIPTNILSSINQSTIKEYIRYQLEYCSGERSLMNFKRNMAFPFSYEGIRDLSYNEEKKIFSFRLFSIPMVTYLGRDFSDKRSLLKNVMNGKTKLCTSQIQLKKGKIFMLGVFEIEKTENLLKPERIAEAALSIEFPVTVKTAKSKLQIGSKEEFLYRRLAIQAARKRTQQGIRYAKSGKGYKRKTKAVDRFRERERNYIDNRLHVYSRQLIDFCIKQQAGTLVLINQEKKMAVAKEEEFVLRNWSYYGLIEKIKYKAEMAGIEIIID